MNYIHLTFSRCKMSNMPVCHINRLSRLFPMCSTIIDAQKVEASECYKNLIRYGLIRSVNRGMYAFLPLGLRVMNKLITLVDNEMEKIGAQKLLLPALTDTRLWHATNRYQSNKSELFTVQDRHTNEYILSPTHEEMICQMISNIGTVPLKILPLKLYQISSKWRDEMKPRLGLLRSKEFIMKDLYTFDATLENARETYKSVCETYDNIFQKIGVSFTKAVGDTGSIGGLMSHEYHYTNNVGEDIICVCSSCHYSVNKTLSNESHCPQCNNKLMEQNSSEVGHAFLLDTKYTKLLNVQSTVQNILTPLAMGCFGLGLSRIFTLMVQIQSSKGDLKWPKSLAPYTVCIIPPKAGSKEEIASQYIDPVVEILNRLNVDAVLDDRTDLTIGNRIINSRLIGIPYLIIIGRTAMKSPPLFEIYDVYNSRQCELTLENIHNYFNDGILKTEKTVNLASSIQS